jgi:dihydrofolate reductase
MSNNGKIIVAVSENGVIGVAGRIPWYYPEDLRYFRKRTMNSTVIVGRKTILPSLPGRTVLTISTTMKGNNYFPDIPSALRGRKNVWFIGGGQLYRSALPFCNYIDMTVIPEVISHPDAVFFPSTSGWKRTEIQSHHPDLTHLELTRE